MYTDDDGFEDTEESRLHDDATYTCDSCGEEIVVPLDFSEGRCQRYVEDCPVCCNPNVIFVEFGADGIPLIRSEPEQDH